MLFIKYWVAVNQDSEDSDRGPERDIREEPPSVMKPKRGTQLNG